MCEKSAKKCENFEALRERLSRHLSDSGEVAALSAAFGKLRENYERVNFVADLLEKSKIHYEFIKDCKSEEIAVKMRESGNEMFKIKKLKEAWEFYTKSVSYAEENSVNVALAYANRSAVLFEVNLHKQCLMDISRALESNYPEHLKSKLFVREKNSKNLEIEAFKQAYEPLPLLEKSSSIQSTSDCVEIKENDEMGRHVVATRNIEPGEVLAIEKPFALLLVGHYLSHCHECLNLCYNLIPCKNCTRAMYCSDTCREAAFKKYHQHECLILATLLALEFDKLKILPLKIAFLASDEYKNVKNYENGAIYRSDSYKEVHNLITNTKKRSVADLFERATAGAIIFDLVKNHTDFFKDRDENFENFFKEVVLLHMQTGPSNFHEISELAPSSAGVYEPEEIGSGVFAFLSLLNHSCNSNVIRFCHGSTIVLRAIQSIKKGEQVFDNYGYHYAVTDKLERQRQLKKQYYFDCGCEACQKNWPLYDNLPEVEKAEMDKSILQKLSSADVEFAREVLSNSLVKLKELEESVPSRNFSQIQETVKQCFAIFGNKRRIF